MNRFLGYFGILALLSGCSGGEVQNTSFAEEGSGPEEFFVVPHKRLELPGQYADLPPPMSGHKNRADIDPTQIAIRALGGTPNTFSPIQTDKALQQFAQNAASVSAASLGDNADIGGLDRASAGDKDSASSWWMFWSSDDNIVSESGLRPYLEAENLKSQNVRVPSAPPVQ